MELTELPIGYLFDPNKRLFWGYLLSSLIIAVIATGWKVKQCLTFDKYYWLHNSAILDYQYFFIFWFFKVFLIAPLVISFKDIALWTSHYLRDYLTPMFHVSYSMVVILYTSTLFVTSDFTRYWLHRALHASNFLWKFHKVHHSAEVLTPITFYRIHPVESLLFGIRYAVTAGIVTGIFISLFGAKLHIAQIVGANAFTFLFSILGSNLRHSHVYWGFPPWLESLFISPAQHQLHHQYCYSQTNYGGALAIWDYLFGSIRYSAITKKPSNFGLGKKDAKRFDSLPKLLVTPFKKET